MDSYHLKLSGKAELPSALDITHNFRVLLEGSITSKTESDNEDGTRSYSYLFKPVNVEAITPQGKTIKAKDTRSRSVQLRRLLWKKWNEANEPVEFPAYYDAEMLRIIKQQYEN